MAVLRLLNVVIENYAEGEVEMLEAVNNSGGCRHGHAPCAVPRKLWIEQDAPPKYYRLSPGTEVRLRYACFVTCVGVVKEERTGEVVDVRCTYDPATRGGEAPDERKVKGTIHWVSAPHALEAEVRSMSTLILDAQVRPAAGDRYQVERHGLLLRPTWPGSVTGSGQFPLPASKATLAAHRRRCRGGGLRAPTVSAPAERISNSLG